MQPALILALLQIVPQLFATAQQMIANGQIKDQATLDAVIQAQRAAALIDFGKLQSELQALDGNPPPAA